jgi:tetratricopeptide (TPR) repeat protein
VLHTLGDIAVHEGSLERAESLYAEALRINDALRLPLGLVESYERCAHIALAQGRREEAARLYADAAHLRSRMGTPIPLLDKDTVDADLEVLRGAIE